MTLNLEKLDTLDAELRSLASVERQGGPLDQSTRASQAAREFMRAHSTAREAASATTLLLEVLRDGGETDLPGTGGVAFVHVRYDDAGRLAQAHVALTTGGTMSATEVEAWVSALGLEWAGDWREDGTRALSLRQPM